jgi:hypothetical protein
MAWEVLIRDEAGVQDTINLIIKTINEYCRTDEVNKVINYLHPAGSKKEFLKRLFQFACKYPYKEDENDHEKVFTLPKIFRDGFNGIDCKKQTTLIACLLKTAGIEPLLKVVSYDGKTWKHIYVITKIRNEYITLDPVNHKRYNEEVTHRKADIFNLKGMKLSLLGNAPPGQITDFSNAVASFNDDLNGIVLSGPAFSYADLVKRAAAAGAKAGFDFLAPKHLAATIVSHQKSLLHHRLKGEDDLSGFLDKAKALFKKVEQKVVAAVKTVGHAITHPAEILHAAKTIALAPVRNAFLGLLDLGKALEHTPIKMHMSKKLAQAWNSNPQKIKDFWISFGGDPNALKATLQKTSGIQLAGIVLSGIELHGQDNVPEYYRDKPLQLSGVGDPGTLAAISAAIAAATPILLTAQKFLTDSGILKKGGPDDKNLTTLNNALVESHDTAGNPPAPAAAAGSTAQGSFICGSIGNLLFKSVFFGALAEANGFTLLYVLCSIGIVYSISKIILKKLHYEISI